MVFVCGGGPAGVAAAITAASNGSEVILAEKNGCLGGTLTSSLIGIILDEKNKTSGLIREICDAIKTEITDFGVPVYEAEKYIFEQMCLKSGVKILYNTYICDVKIENEKIIEITTVSKSGKKTYMPEVVIDATGDGDVAYMAGCEFEAGNNEGKTQPMSMVAVIAGINQDAVEHMISTPAKPFWESRNNFNGLLNKLGIHTSMGACANITRIDQNLCYISINHEYGYKFDNAEEISKAIADARKEIYETVKALRIYGGAFKNISLVCTPEMIGVREGRRIKGFETVTIDDMINGTKRENGICTVTYWVDIHSLTKSNGSKGFEGDNINVQPYDIPMGALIPQKCKNLVLSGRNISGDFYAHASYRVAGNMIPVGQASGAIAHSIEKHGISAQQVEFSMIKDMLI